MAKAGETQDRCTQYALDVVSGKITAGEYVRLACQRHLDDIEKSKAAPYKYYFDVEKSEEIINFAEELTIAEGEENEHVTAYPFQCFILGSLNGWRTKEKSYRRFRTSYVQLGRQNGKSFINGILACYYGNFDGYKYGKIFCTATKQDQANIVFDEVAKFINSDEDLSEWFKVHDHNHTIDCLLTHSEIVSATFTGVKDTMNSLMSTANTLTGGKLDSIKSAFSSKLASAKSTASSAMENIKSSFSSKMESAHGAVTGALSRIKSAFNFKWSLPHLNLPHISVSGGVAPFGIGGKGSLPSFSIQWYKSGGIMTNPTVFGINGNSLMVGGEAGDEAILPLAEFYNKLNSILDKKLDAVQKSQVVYVTNHTYIDGDEIASRTVSKVDAEMVTNKRKGR